MQVHTRQGAKVSIGLPVYNAASTLIDAIRSVLAQTMPCWELILVDDGSTDGSAELARRVCDGRVRRLADGRHLGLAARLNEIVALSDAEYIARMDADDVMHPDRLARQLAYLESNPKVEVLGTAAYVMDRDGRVFGVRGRYERQPDVRSVITNGLFIHPTVTGRRTWFEANPYDPAYPRAEDHELWARTFAHSQFASLAEPLLFYREHVQAGVKYAASCRTDRRIYRTYGRPALGPLRTTAAIVRSHAKSMAYSLTAALHLEPFLLARRNRPLSGADRACATRALAVVRRMPVPGIDQITNAAPS